jgi:hypothetical protein
MSKSLIKVGANQEGRTSNNKQEYMMNTTMVKPPRVIGTAKIPYWGHFGSPSPLFFYKGLFIT